MIVAFNAGLHAYQSWYHTVSYAAKRCADHTAHLT